jgi:hypothetical protein
MPLLDVFFTMMWFFLWILWFFLLLRVILDIFRSRDLGGWGKAGWLVFAIVLPFLGVLVYLIARGGKMADREASQAQATHARQGPPRAAPPTSSPSWPTCTTTGSSATPTTSGARTMSCTGRRPDPPAVGAPSH